MYELITLFFVVLLFIRNFAEKNKNGIIGKNKFHEAIEIDSIVFDNLETKGVKLDDWLDDIDFHFNNKYKTQYINILEW